MITLEMPWINLTISVIWSMVQFMWGCISYIVDTYLIATHIMICLYICTLFEEHLRMISKDVHEGWRIRLKFHLHSYYLICDFLEKSNELLGVYLFFAYIFLIPSCCYGLFQYYFSIQAIIMKVVWINATITYALFLFAISYFAARVNVAAHRPLHLLYGAAISGKFNNCKFQVFLLLFLSLKLNKIYL